jgi:hypothetical protein
MGSPKIDAEVLRKFRKHKVVLRDIFVEITSRRQEAKITLGEAYRDLSGAFGLSSFVSSWCADLIANLESIEHLERILMRPYNLGGTQTNHSITCASKLEIYALRQSCYTQYLGFDIRERNEFFDEFSTLNPEISYRENRTKISLKVKALLKKRTQEAA